MAYARLVTERRGAGGGPDKLKLEYTQKARVHEHEPFELLAWRNRYRVSLVVGAYESGRGADQQSLLLGVQLQRQALQDAVASDHGGHAEHDMLANLVVRQCPGRDGEDSPLVAEHRLYKSAHDSRDSGVGVALARKDVVDAAPTHLCEAALLDILEPGRLRVWKGLERDTADRRDRPRDHGAVPMLAKHGDMHALRVDAQGGPKAPPQPGAIEHGPGPEDALPGARRAVDCQSCQQVDWIAPQQRRERPRRGAPSHV